MRHASCFVLAFAAILAGCSSGSGGDPVRQYRMGDRVEVGRLIYNVFETQWLTHLGETSGARVPQNRFLLVRVSVVNSGGKPATVPTFQLVGDAGETYTEVADGKDVPNWIGFLREIQPAETLQGNAVFDVNPGHYKLRVADEADERAAVIDMPLQFQAETPALASPAGAQPELQLQSPSNSSQ
jgi:hypothetical protein